MKPNTDEMLKAEAREWLQRYRKKALEYGTGEAREWWHKTIADIERIRGKDAANQLRKAMNETRFKG
jgi:hypothetical protein